MNLAMNKTAPASFTKYKLGAFALVLAQTTWTNAADAQTFEYVNKFADSTPKRSQPQIPVSSSKKQPGRSGRVSFVSPKLPFTGIPSGRARGAGSRSNCLNVDIPLTALVPTEQKLMTNEQQKARLVTNVWGLTAKSHPTFLFYVPYAQGLTQTGEFVLQDAEDNDVYRTTINLPQTPSIVSLSLESMSAPLKVGKMYHWYFKVRCQAQTMSGPIFVEGWVQRVKLDSNIAEQIAVATPYQKIALYAENGIWYDTVADLAAMRSHFPDESVEVDWQKLLQSVGLSNVQSESVVAATSASESKGEKTAGGEIVNF